MRKSLPIYPTLGEVHQMAGLAPNERDRMLVMLLWWTGGRISEVLSIRVGDITTSGVRMKNLKQHQPMEKHVFLSPDVLHELRAFCVGKPLGSFLIGRDRDGGRISRKHGWAIVKRLALAAGVLRRRFGAESDEPIWPHTLRHGYAVNLLSQGVPITAVQGQLGHASLANTAIYTQLADPQRQAMVARAKF